MTPKDSWKFIIHLHYDSFLQQTFLEYFATLACGDRVNNTKSQSFFPQKILSFVICCGYIYISYFYLLSLYAFIINTYKLYIYIHSYAHTYKFIVHRFGSQNDTWYLKLNLGIELSSNAVNQLPTIFVSDHAKTFICSSSIFDHQCLNKVPLLRSNKYSELTFIRIGFDKICRFHIQVTDLSANIALIRYFHDYIWHHFTGHAKPVDFWIASHRFLVVR